MLNKIYIDNIYKRCTMYIKCILNKEVMCIAESVYYFLSDCEKYKGILLETVC